MNRSLAHHALLVLVMVALMLAGGLIESGRTPVSPVAAEANAAAPVVLYASAVSACDHVR